MVCRDRQAGTVKVIRVCIYTVLIFFSIAGFMCDAYDVLPPTVEIKGGEKYIIVYLGEGIAYREHLNISDNYCAGEQINVKIDNREINIQKAGIYTVYVSATDRNNNTATEQFEVKVISSRISQDELFDEIAKISEKIIAPDMSSEEKCRLIYAYIRRSVEYSEQSEFTEWRQAAYHGLINLRGDCFTYACVARAFFEYLGIECLMVQRIKGKTSDTHFWNMVNIGTEEQPRWYHFDCTRLFPDMSMMGCLMTNAQLDLYSKYRSEHTGNARDRWFYLYDKEQYPSVSGEEITDIFN